MSEPQRSIRVDQVAWGQLLPWLAIFKTFRMAIRPSKMLLALSMLILVFVLGHGLDVVWGPQAIPGEVDAYGSMSRVQFDAWKQDQINNRDRRLRGVIKDAFSAGKNQQLIEEELVKPNKYQFVRLIVDDHFKNMHRNILRKAQEKTADGKMTDQTKQWLNQQMVRMAKSRLIFKNKLASIEPVGIFRATFEYKFAAFDRLIQSAIGLKFGVSQILSDPQIQPDTVVGSLRSMVLILPAWLYGTHPGFLALLSFCMLFIMAFFGGTLARLAAMDATGASHAPVTGSIQFVLKRYVWFVLTPMMPVIMVAVLGLLLMFGGLVFFNFPGLDMLGGFLFFIALMLGFGISLLLLFTLATYPLFYPALVMEGTDSFDAVSRCFGYLVARPWHWIFYSVLALVYGAIGYLLIGSVIYLTMYITHQCVDVGVFAQMADESSRWHAIMPAPELGHLLYTFNWDAQLGFTGKVTAGMIWVWSFFLTSLIGAYTVSFFYCSNTVIYQLLRQSSEQTRLDEIVMDPVDQKSTPAPQDTPDKVEQTPSSPEVPNTPEAPEG